MHLDGWMEGVHGCPITRLRVGGVGIRGRCRERGALARVGRRGCRTWRDPAEEAGTVLCKWINKHMQRKWFGLGMRWEDNHGLKCVIDRHLEH